MKLRVPSYSTFDVTVHLAYGEVWRDIVTNPQYIEVVIKASKIDVFRKGFTVYLGVQVLKSSQWCYPELNNIKGHCRRSIHSVLRWAQLDMGALCGGGESSPAASWGDFQVTAFR